MSIDWKTQYNEAILPKHIYRFSVIPLKIQWSV